MSSKTTYISNKSTCYDAKLHNLNYYGPLVTQLTSVAPLQQEHNPEEGRNTGRNMLVRYINNCPRCNTKQSIYYSASSLYMFRVSTTHPSSGVAKLGLAWPRWTYITVQRDATQNSVFIILQVHSTCFGCQPHPSSGAHKTVTTVSGIFCAVTSLQRVQATPNISSTQNCNYSLRYLSYF